MLWSNTVTADVAQLIIGIVKDHHIVDVWPNEMAQNNMRNAIDDYSFDVVRDEKGIDTPLDLLDDIDLRIMDKGTIQRHAELGETTVKRIVREFLKEGILIETGACPCKNGFTVVYLIDLTKVEVLEPTLVRGAERLATRLRLDGCGHDQGQSRRHPAQPSVDRNAGSDPRGDRARTVSDVACNYIVRLKKMGEFLISGEIHA